jgi:protein TonB
MRYLPALIGALLITVAVFLFMESLIERGREESVPLVVHQEVEIFRPDPDQQEPDEPEETLQEPAQEPTMEPMDIMQVTPPTPEPATEPDSPPLDLGVGDINVGPVGKRWSAPMTGGIDVGGGGRDGRGFVEVVPYNTRRPNVPDAAFQNKIDGWVLVAFSVTPDGRTRDIRVLDAKPRGVFEEKVIAAVGDWTYKVNFYGKVSGQLVLTQKVEVQWKNYHLNMPNVD